MIKDLNAVCNFLEQEVRKFTDICVVGVSGGVDSSVVASICVKALGKDNVYLVSMPYDQIDQKTFNARSTKLAERLGANHFSIPIKSACLPLEQELEKSFNTKLEVLTYANIRPRVRMNILYSVCGQLGLSLNKRARVMGTGHLSEDIIGYDTKGGDALCDIFILADFVKSEIYQLAEHYQVDPEIIEAKPSAGLYPEQTDEAELGYTYTELESATLAIRSLIVEGVKPELINPNHLVFKGIDKNYVEFVIKRYQTHFHKHQAPVNLIFRNSNWFNN